MIVAGREKSPDMDVVTRLVRYDTARRALHEARSVDEVKEIRNQAEAMRAYALQARDANMIADAIEIKLRAERRLGELMAEQARIVGKAKPRGSNQYKERVSRKPDALPTLEEAGIDNNLANRSRRAAAVTSKAFDDVVRAARDGVTGVAARALAQIDKKGRRTARKAHVRQPQPQLSADKRYGVIYADPATRWATTARTAGCLASWLIGHGRAVSLSSNRTWCFERLRAQVTVSPRRRRLCGPGRGGWATGCRRSPH